jgi:hypothetical protein
LWILAEGLKSGAISEKSTPLKNNTMKLKQIYKPVRAIGSDPHLTVSLMSALASPKHRRSGLMEALKRLANKYGVAI